MIVLLWISKHERERMGERAPGSVVSNGDWNKGKPFALHQLWTAAAIGTICEIPYFVLPGRFRFLRSFWEHCEAAIYARRHHVSLVKSVCLLALCSDRHVRALLLCSGLTTLGCADLQQILGDNMLDQPTVVCILCYRSRRSRSNTSVYEPTRGINGVPHHAYLGMN